MSTRKGIALWISGHKQESFLEIPLHHQARVDAIDASVVAISCGLIGEGSPLSDSVNGFFSLAKRISWDSPITSCRDAARDDASHGARRRGARGQRCALCHHRGDVTRRGGSQVPWKHHKAFEVTTSELDGLQSGVVDPRPSRSRRLHRLVERLSRGAASQWRASPLGALGIARPWRQPPQATLRARLVVCRASLARGTWTLDHPQACFGAPGGSVLCAFFKRPARLCLPVRRVRAKRTEERL